MSLWDEMLADGDEILATFGREATFRGKKVLVMVNTNQMDQLMMDGGFAYKAHFRIRFLLRPGTDLHAQPPKSGEQLSLFGSAFTIVSVTYRPPSPWMDVQVQSSTQ